MPYNRKNIVVSAAPICSNDLSNKGKLHTMLFSSSDGSDFTQQYLARCTDEADRVEDILDAHFPDFDGRNEILPSVGSRLSYRKLASGKDYGFVEILQHKAQGRCGIGHCVGSVEYDKAIIGAVVVPDKRCEGLPWRASMVLSRFQPT